MLDFIRDRMAQASGIIELLRKVPLEVLMEVSKDVEALYSAVDLKTQVAIAVRISATLATLSSTQTDDKVVAAIGTITSGSMGQAVINWAERLYKSSLQGDFVPQSIESTAGDEENATFEPQSLLLAAAVVSATVSTLRYLHEIRKDKEEEERRKKED